MLDEYLRKRNFDKTPEPAPSENQSEPGNRFVVQEHHASHLHWDFRLEMDGVLKSWAVPKGVPLNRNEKRLAVMTEDHPVEYIDFEGTIPEGQYGAGKVYIWDRGTYDLLERRDDKIEFTLDGNRLKGRYVLIKLKNQQKNWLLIKLD